MGRLEGKVAVVLGAAGKGNMGQTVARRFAAEGARVVVAGRSEAPLAELAAGIGGAHALCDITKKAEVEALADFAQSKYGKVDVAMNCVGWAPLVKLLETSEETMDRLAAIQFKGPHFFFQAFCARMAKTGGGSLITVSSASVYALLYHHAAYIATKAAADALVRCFANEFGAKGIKVNSIAPGLTESPMTERDMNTPGLLDLFRKEYPLGRIGTSQDVANAALWLATDESFLTGQVLQVNGGLTLRRNPNPWEISAAMKAAQAKSPQGA